MSPIWLFLILLPATLLAQTSASSGSVQGSVVDSSGSAVPGARILVRNQETKAGRTTETDNSGQFTVRGLPIGTYTVQIESPGFTSVVLGPFLLSVGQVVSQRVDLKPEGVVEKLEVREEPEAIDTAAATSSVALGYERIEEAPARSRNYLNFVLTAPGVAPSAGASSQRTMTGVRAPLGDSGFTFSGMRPRNNSILIDGMDNRDETTGGNRVAVGLEMIQEFRIAGTAVGAELGGAAGGLLNVVTRSGVNIWHGDMTFFAQKETFNARRPEIQSVGRPQFRRYQPGVSANGPLRLDRTFISGAVEYESESADEWSNVSQEAADGINEALSKDIYASSPVRAYRGLYSTGTRGVEFSVKLNHQIAQSDTISARYAYSRGRLRHEVQGPDNFADRSAQGSSLTVDHSLVGNWLRVVSPRVVNDIRVQIAERSMNLRPNGSGPMLEIPGVATLGSYYRMDSNRVERHAQLADSINVSLGPHRLSAGFDVHAIALDSSMRHRYRGIFVFPSLSDFALGRPDIFVQAFGDPHTRFTTIPFGLWLQERWDLRRGLLLELGVRYDRQRMPPGITRSSDNVAPRAGIAWRPLQNRPLVLRAGFGLFYDRYPLAFLNDALQKDGMRGFEQYAVGENAIRALQFSRGSTLATPLPGLPPSEYRTASFFPSSYSRKLTAGFEYGLDKDTSISVEASQIRGVHLPRIRNASASLPPNYLLEQTAWSKHIGMSVSLNRRMSREVAYLLSWNTGRTRDDGSDFDEHPSDPLNIRRDWGWSRQHQAHRVALSGLFELPDEAAARLPRLVAETLDAVSFAPIFTLGSGRPINALLTTDAYRTGAYPLSARPPSMPRNPFRSPRTVMFDLRVMKTLRMLEGRAVLQFGAETFNLLNHTNTERVSQYFASGDRRLPTYGQTLESLPARQIQFLMQFEY